MGERVDEGSRSATWNPEVEKDHSLARISNNVSLAFR